MNSSDYMHFPPSPSISIISANRFEDFDTIFNVNIDVLEERGSTRKTTM